MTDNRAGGIEDHQAEAAEKAEEREDRVGPQESGGDPIVLRIGQEELVVRQRFETLSILNEIIIAVLFTLGSVAFYWQALYTFGVTLFVIGSVALGVRPAIRFARRVRLRRLTLSLPHEVARDF